MRIHTIMIGQGLLFAEHSQSTFKDTLAEERDRVLRDRSAGTICKCCDQFVKVYKRKLNVGMAVVLIHLFKTGIPDYVHLEKFIKERGLPQSFRADYHKLTAWNLLEKKIQERDDGSHRNGYYRITEKGRLFAQNLLKVPEYVIIFNGKIEGFSGEHISVVEALKNKFNYTELMNA